MLWASTGKHLVRSEIHKRMLRENRPTLGRVGQILSALHKDKLLVRVVRRSQGSKKAGFFALSERGRELCRVLGFEHEERLLFPATQEKLRTWLTPDRLRPRPPGKIVAVYGYRGRLGRTTLVAHVARGLAENLTDDKQLLVVDLDLERPGLDDFFRPPEHGECRGLGGLLLDFERKAPRKRAFWLRGALASQRYVLHPLPKVPGLAYLPSGLGAGQQGLSPSERAEAVALLNTEAGLATPTSGRSEHNLKTLGFLSELRAALREKFERTVLDPQSGHSLGAWIATQTLADELVLCSQAEDESQATVDGLRAVLANFLHQQDGNSTTGGGMFLFRLTQPTTFEDLNQWIDRNLVMKRPQPEGTLDYQPEQLVYDIRLAENRHRWENKHFYRHLITRLDPGATDRSEISSPELQALLAVLDPNKDQAIRSLALGILENAALPELSRWIDWYVRRGSLPTATDSQGEESIRCLLEVISNRLLSRILRSRDHCLVATARSDIVFSQLSESIVNCISETQDCLSRLKTLAESIADVPEVAGAVVVACDEDATAIRVGCSRQVRFSSGMPSLFKLPAIISPLPIGTGWTELQSDQLELPEAQALMVRWIEEEQQPVGAVIIGLLKGEYSRQLLKGIDRSLKMLGTAIQTALKLEEDRCLARLREIELEELGLLKPIEPQAIALRIKESFDAEAVTILLREQGKLYLSATTEPETDRWDAIYDPGDFLTRIALNETKSIRLQNGRDLDEIQTKINRDITTNPNIDLGQPETLARSGDPFRFLATPMRYIRNPERANRDGETPPDTRRSLMSRGLIRVLRNKTQLPFSMAENNALQQFADLLGLAIRSAWRWFIAEQLMTAETEAILITRNEHGDAPKMVFADPGAEALFSMAREQLEAMDPRDLYAVGQYSKIDKLLTDAGAENKDACGPIRSKVIRMSGSGVAIRSVEISFRLFKSNFVQAPIWYTIAVMRDITDSRPLVELLDKKGVAYFRADSKGYTIESSLAESKLTGYTQHDLESMHRSKLYRDASEREELFKTVDKHDGALVPARKRLRRRDGTFFFAEGVIQLIKDNHGNKLGHEGLYEDITDRLRLQGFLDVKENKVLKEHELYEELQANARFQLLFMTSIGHQLRSPLGALAEQLRNFQEGLFDSERFPKRLEYAIGQAKVCSLLVANLTYMDKILSGSTFNFEPISLADLAIETGRNFRHLLAEKNLDLRIDEASIRNTLDVWGHQELLRQILVNLLDNAIKYSIPGTWIEICARRRARRSYLQISNQGLPIPRDVRERIFERGFRMPHAEALIPAGTGLGLWLVRKIATAHRATIHCTEVLEQDQNRTAFKVAFPSEPATSSAERFE